MHTYVNLFFSPDGISPLEIAERLREHAGLSFIVGAHDLVFEWSSVKQFRERLQKLHLALQGTGVTYRLESVIDDPTFIEPTAWPPPLPGLAREMPTYAPEAEK
jgi:hypothetical protein